MRILGVIPARFAASRFPGKLMAPILGKPLLAWVIEGAKTSRVLSELIVATDNVDLAKLARDLKVEAVMTDPELPSGSDRIWAAVKDRPCDLVVNIQGDEPLVEGHLIDQLCEPFKTRSNLQIATLGKALLPEELENTQSVKLILNRHGQAIYFSRFGIPYSRLKPQGVPKAALKHIGMYAYRKDFLGEFCQAGPTDLERGESLEQLRALYLGASIQVVQTEHDSWGVDVPEDVGRVEKLLTARGKA